jgi:hypothetical protein
VVQKAFHCCAPEAVSKNRKKVIDPASKAKQKQIRQHTTHHFGDLA